LPDGESCVAIALVSFSALKSVFIALHQKYFSIFSAFFRDSQVFKNEVTALHENGAKRAFLYIIASTITCTDKVSLPGKNFQ
jgi:hypothetical protein